ncbi:MAG: TRAP transporter permease [Spirochaetales bacterium]
MSDVSSQEQVQIEDVLSKVDKESGYRKLLAGHHRLVSLLAIGFSVFQLYTASFGLLPAQMQRAVHLLFVLLLAYLLYPYRKGKRENRIPWYDALFAIGAACSAFYIAYNYTGLMERAGAFTPMDITVGTLGILFVLEACRRVVGLPILIIACSFIAYAFLGPYMPGFLNHRGYSFRRIVGHLYYTTEGILGLPLGVSSTFIFLFILFGAFLDKTGIGKFFIDMANAIAGFSAGGPAKVAVISSAMMGTISGSSVSNTVGTGSFTIPLMKKLGYKPEFAGAVEAAASTGGQLMPPIMGAAAFLMAETLGIPYLEVAKAAIIPAILYFSGIFIMVHLEAKKLGLVGIPRNQLPRLGKVLKEQGHLILPLLTILYFLIEGATPMKAALYGIVTSILAGMIRASTRMKPKDFIDALETAGRTIIGVAIACATAGIIIGIVTLTGLGLKMASGLVALAGGMKVPTLLFTMLASLVLGMGVPTTANYLITSTITAPAVVQLGVPMLAAHLFAFYFGIIADVTPPVALAAYAGSAIARGNPFRTGLTASRLAIAAFIIPYMFALNPVLILIGATPLKILQILGTALLGMLGIGAAMEGYFLGLTKPWERVLYLAGGLLLIDPTFLTDTIGFALIALGLFLQFSRRKLSSVKIP